LPLATGFVCSCERASGRMGKQTPTRTSRCPGLQRTCLSAQGAERVGLQRGRRETVPQAAATGHQVRISTAQNLSAVSPEQILPLRAYQSRDAPPRACHRLSLATCVLRARRGICQIACRVDVCIEACLLRQSRPWLQPQGPERVPRCLSKCRAALRAPSKTVYFEPVLEGSAQCYHRRARFANGASRCGSGGAELVRSSRVCTSPWKPRK
jgi:hypothetical protein